MDNYGEKHLKEHILNAGWGFIFKNTYGEFLTKGLFWFPHLCAEEAYVHSVSKFDCERWEVKPSKMIPAKFENGQVTVLGEEMTYDVEAI